MKKTALRLLVIALLLFSLLSPLGVFPARATSGYCTGGTITASGSYIVHTFLYNGILTCPGTVTMDILMVGGGGGGGRNNGGGGGAGTVLYTSTTITTGAYTATIGAGGLGSSSTSTTGYNGYNTTFATLTALGGGGGGSSASVNGAYGGSGGGGTGASGYGGYANGAGYVNGGGNGATSAGGGGGGAGANGVNATSSAGKDGGIGISIDINGTPTYYGGGGGGAGHTTSGTGGTGGGGNGGGTPTAGSINTGGGGGGGSDAGGGSGVVGNAGGSGIIIIRYPDSYLTPTPTASNTPTITLTPTMTATGATNTPTASLTLTPTNTPTSTYTPTFTFTPTHTPTPTLTITPNPNITWAPSSVSITGHMQNALAATLHATPPSGVTGSLYGLLGADSDGSGGWYISLSALTGISPPYTGWDALANGQWMGSLHCTGTEPAWTCDYYVPAVLTDIGAENATGLLFPWQSGTWARYGELGIHHDGNGMLPGDSAVDFKGDDTWSGSMPPRVYAVAAGTVVSHCDGAHQGGIVVDGPSGRYMYFHLLPGQSKMATGTVLSQGEQIGGLAYGNWNDSPCGISTINSASGYHLHFAFLPEGGYFQIGGCSLDLSTTAWLCGTDTIYKGGQLPNGGGPGPVPTPGPGTPTITPGGPTVTPVPGGSEGGEHIWNGLITGFITGLTDIVKRIMPAHTSWGLATWVDNAFTVLSEFSFLFAMSGLVWIVPSVICYGIIMMLESLRFIYALLRLIYGLFPMAA